MTESFERKRYTATECLGEGAFAKVYLATDEKLKRPVAVKVFKSHNTEEQLKRFKREADVCKGLRHPNIIRIYDAVVSDEYPKIIMEYIPAVTLQEYVRENKPTVEEILSIGLQLSSALAYIHEVGILHRDIKPANIMIEQPLRAILMDFNLAFSNDFTQLTKEGFVVGTPAFMAPELFKGAPSNGKTDIYGLGLVLYDLLTFGAVSKAIIAIPPLSAEQYDPPSKVNPLVPREVDKAILWLIDRDPKRRCSDINKFIEVVHKLQDRQCKDHSITTDHSIVKDHPIVDRRPVEERSSSKPFSRLSVRLVARVLAILFIFLFCAFGVKMLSRSGFTRLSSSVEVENKSFSALIPFVTMLNSNGLSFQEFTDFLEKENALFESLADSPEGLFSHCEGIRQLVRHSKSDVAMQAFLDYLYRLRKESNLASQSHDVQVKFLKRAVEQFVIEETANRGGDALRIAQYLYLDFWRNSLRNVSTSLRVADSFQQFFRKQPESIRRSDGGRAFYHGVLLTRLYGLEKLPQDFVQLILLTPPYENTVLSKLRMKVLKVTQVKVDNRQSFAGQMEDLCGQYAAFLGDLENVKWRIRQGAYDEVTFPFPANSSEGSLRTKKHDQLIGQCLDALVCGSCIMELGDGCKDLGISLAAAGLNVLQYDKFRFEFMLIHGPKGRASSGLGSLQVATRTARELFAVYSCMMGSQSYGDIGRILENFNDVNLILDTPLYNEIKDDIQFMLSRSKQYSPELSIALRLIPSKFLQPQPVRLKELKISFEKLLKEGHGLKGREFLGWSALTAVLSNEMFIQMKKNGAQKDRYTASERILRLLTEYFPGKIFDGRGKNCGYYYNGAENLRRLSIIHCCDSLICQGKTREDIPSELSRQIAVQETLNHLASAGTTDIFRATDVAASKILSGKKLEVEDIFANGLNYLD